MAQCFPLSAANFYGKRKPESESPMQKRIRLAVESRKETKIDAHPFYACLSKGNDLWNVYARQKDAFDYMEKEMEPNLRLFSFESVHGPLGKRHYIVCTAERFWHEYCKISQRHCYELIMEKKPCRLYFDVEFYKHSNPLLNGEKCLESMINFVCDQLFQQFQVECNRGSVLDLDATTGDKFSHHLIFHLPDKKLFSSNAAVGQFVMKLRDKCSPPPLNYTSKTGAADDAPIENDASLWVKNRNGIWVPLWDEAVYSRNRNFRLYLSTKLGHQNPLKTSQTNRFYARKPGAFTIFQDSLITALNAEECQLLPVDDPGPESETVSENKSPFVGKSSKLTEEGFGSSPFPAVDAFLLNVLKKRKPNSFLRSWKLFENVDDGNQCCALPTISHEVGNNRYCYNIEREHRSNHVMWIVDLNREVFYQKCHDPDCRSQGFRSNEFPLDPCLIENQKKLGNDVVGQCDKKTPSDNEDAELCKMVELMEKEGVVGKRL